VDPIELAQGRDQWHGSGSMKGGDSLYCSQTLCYQRTLLGTISYEGRSVWERTLTNEVLMYSCVLVSKMHSC
jgi:hypothetical protein